MGFQRFPIVVAGSSAELKFSSAGRDGAKIERKLRLRQNGGEEENEADVKGSEGIHTIGAVRALLSVRERYGAAGKAWQAKKRSIPRRQFSPHSINGARVFATAPAIWQECLPLADGFADDAGKSGGKSRH